MNQCGIRLDLPSLRYAEDDASALRDVLTDSRIGTFDPDDATLLVGRAATAQAVKAHLRAVCAESEPTDVLLFYFAGHAVVPQWSRHSDAYLATSDLDVAALREAPDIGLRMSFLKRDVFEYFQGTSFLILDCCHAGGYVESDAGYPDAIDTYSKNIVRHSALLSCPKDGVARESDRLRHGHFTHLVLHALTGDAAGDDGRVSFLQMANHVVELSPHPAPGQSMQAWGPTTVLTQPLASRHERKRPLTERAGTARVVPCDNPLDRCASSINQLLERMFQSAGTVRAAGPEGQADKAEWMRSALEADAVAVVDYTPSGFTVVDSTAGFRKEELAPLLEQGGAYIFPPRATWLGYVSSDDAGRRVLCIPLSHDEHRALVLAVVEPPLALLEMGEPLAVMLHAAWNADVAKDPLAAEVEVLTAMRSASGRLPQAIYEHCAARHAELIDSLTMVFQPVITLDTRPRGVGIHSFEALARRAEGDLRAPLSVLRLAHVWGDRFIIERDAILLAKAIRLYAEADSESPFHTPKPISVNVAVRSLLSDAYRASLRSTLAAADINPGVVTLEISEHDAIEPAPGESWPEEPLTYFHRRLTDLSRELEISFAVDDFGVGYSSLSRMAELPLTQIKVDRAVLHHPMALDELDLVMKVARHAADKGHAPVPRAVILEGFDQDSPIPLHEIYHRRIRYVQGHVAQASATSKLLALPEDVRARIASLVRGPE